MTEPISETDADRQARMERAVSELEAARLRGEEFDLADWLERHPDLSVELGESLRILGGDSGASAKSARPSGEQTTVVYPHAPKKLVADGHHVTTPERLGDYEILEPLDAGGEGMVFRARHRLNDHVVALKMLPPGLNRDQNAIHRLREEARAIAALRHDHIVPIHFVGEEDGTWYYTMPLMPGGSLKGRRGATKSEIPSVVRLLKQVARGIHHAHSRGVLHLDLKPANVLLDHLGRPYVSDFGLALRVDEVEQEEGSSGQALLSEPSTDTLTSISLTSPQIRGTAPFMSPEVASGKTSVFSTAADVYGLGALLYTLLTGRAPFGGRSFAETLKFVTTETPVAPRKLNRKVDRELEAVCLKCLEKDPASRYASADAFAADLARWLRGEPTQAGRPNWPKRAWFAVCRHPWVVGLSLAGALAIGLATQVGSLSTLHAAGARDAHRLAGYMGKELEIVRRGLIDTQASPELMLALQEQEPGSLQQRQTLDAFLVRMTAAFQAWFGLGVGSPLLNIFVLDSQGVLLADTTTPGSTSVLGRSFAERDYFRHFLDRNDQFGIQNTEIYISRIFHSLSDGRYKLALAIPIREHQGALIGVLVANISLAARLGMVDLTDEPIGATISAPMDWSYGEQDTLAPVNRPEFIAAFDRRYAAHEVPDPIWLWPDAMPRLADFLGNLELEEAHDYGYQGAALLYERVKGTPLVVVIRQKYPWPAHLLFDDRLRPGLIAFGAVALSGVALLLSHEIRKWKQTSAQNQLM